MRESPHLNTVTPLVRAGSRLSLARGKETAAQREQETGQRLALARESGPAIGAREAVAGPLQSAGHLDAHAVRTLLYVARVPDETLAAHLQSRGWTVAIARSAHELGRLLKPELACAGIVDLTSFAPRDLAGLEASLRQQQVGWIALATEIRRALCRGRV